MALTIPEAAALIGVDTMQLFIRAKKMYGNRFDGNPSNDHGRWRAYGDGMVPVYVKEYLGYVERMNRPGSVR